MIADKDTIQRTEYNFVYAENSEVFHRRNCKAILGTKHVIRGAVYYHSCEDLGLRPCKLCNPTSGDLYRKIKKPKAKKSVIEQERYLKREEQQALNRFKQAHTERFSRPNLEFKSQTEKDDFYTLTQTRFAFWAAAGYATFHRRDCRKLQGLSKLHGFSRFQDATRAGYTPCRYCKPNAKQDILYSIPMMNRTREDECVGDLEALCKQYDYPYYIEDDQFFFSTPVGKWKIRVLLKPYVVHHINLVSTPGNEFYHHRQPRLFLSLLDTFDYIHKHDKELEARTYNRRSMPEEHAINE